MGMRALVVALEVGVVLAAAMLIVPVLLKRPVRREMLAHKGLSLVAIALGTVLAFLLVQAAVRSPLVRHVALALTAVGTAVALLRGRASYGVGRGLPPGSLGLATSLDAIDDPAFYARAVERWGSVFKMSQIHQPVVCIADIGLAHALFATHADSLTQSKWSFNRLVPGGYLEYMRGEAHRRCRAALSADFDRTDVHAAQRVIRAATRAQLWELCKSGPDGVDPEPFLLPVPLTSLFRTMLGVESSHPRFGALVDQFTDLIRPMELYLPVPRRARATYQALSTEVRALGSQLEVASAGRHTSVLAAMVSRDPEALNDETLIGNLILMVKEGSIMVRGLLRWVLKMLCDHPEWAVRLRREAGDAVQFDRLAQNFVLETLRLHESRYIYRTATRDLAVGSYRIPQGWLVRLCLGEAHEQHSHFDQPALFNPDRFDNARPGSDVFAPFGHGERACLGAGVTLEIAQLFVQEASLQVDLTTTADGPPWRINRHWGLWRPSQQWRVKATPRADGTMLAQSGSAS
jgi:cytochrome P450